MNFFCWVVSLYEGFKPIVLSGEEKAILISLLSVLLSVNTLPIN